MALRDIVLHMTAGDPGLAEARIAYATALAAKHKASLVGLFTRPSFPLAYHYISGTIVREYVETVGLQAEAAKKAFEAARRELGIDGAWIETEGGASSTVHSHARVADLLVLMPPSVNSDDPVIGQEYGSELLPHDLILDLGRPVILLPRKAAPAPSTDRVLVGWNGSKEAARAVHDALPILQRAGSVTVMSAGKSRHRGGSGDTLVQHLARHGVRAQLKTAAAGDAEAGDLLLQTASSERADLIVMGAYGYARWREVVFGGATETVLEQAAVPIFFSH